MLPTAAATWWRYGSNLVFERMNGGVSSRSRYSRDRDHGTSAGGLTTSVFARSHVVPRVLVLRGGRDWTGHNLGRAHWHEALHFHHILPRCCPRRARPQQTYNHDARGRRPRAILDFLHGSRGYSTFARLVIAAISPGQRGRFVQDSRSSVEGAQGAG